MTFLFAEQCTDPEETVKWPRGKCDHQEVKQEAALRKQGEALAKLHEAMPDEVLGLFQVEGIQDVELPEFEASKSRSSSGSFFSRVNKKLDVALTWIDEARVALRQFDDWVDENIDF